MDCEINEIWKPVHGFEDKYEISNKGIIHSFKRQGTKGGYTCGTIDDYGYLSIMLSRTPLIRKKIHLLVYETFVGPVPEGYEVHHKNHNPSDNRLENLELLTKEEHYKKHYKPIIQYTLDGEFVAEYKSMCEASKQTGIKQQHISNVCNGKRKTAGCFVWKWKEVA